MSIIIYLLYNGWYNSLVRLFILCYKRFDLILYVLFVLKVQVFVLYEFQMIINCTVGVTI